ncbi:metallophosphoesterase family protein [Rhizobium sp. G187]|uniref:metallophosphoesterase family protein n=1 Tax=Rhizobium sp. G187 TaxID=3451352 RepID=UPI003EE80FA2
MFLEQGRMPRLELPTDRYAAIYAIGDVHGCHDSLLALEEKIRLDAEALDGRKLIVMLGDYIDRGPRSATVLYHLTASPPAGFDRICLRGNHDDAFLDYLEGDPAGDWFLDHGAMETMASYGVELASAGPVTGSNHKLRELVRSAVPSSHLEFLRALPVMLTIGGDVFVHAGIRPGRPLVDQTDEDLMWIRRSFLDLGPGLPVRVVHGHSPMRQAHVGADRVSLDTHCHKTGRLTAARFHQGDVVIFDTAAG